MVMQPEGSLLAHDHPLGDLRLTSSHGAYMPMGFLFVFRVGSLDTRFTITYYMLMQPEGSPFAHEC